MCRKVAFAIGEAFDAAATVSAAGPSNAKIGFTAFSGTDLALLCSSKNSYSVGTTTRRFLK